MPKPSAATFCDTVSIALTKFTSKISACWVLLGLQMDLIMAGPSSEVARVVNRRKKDKMVKTICGGWRIGGWLVVVAVLVLVLVLVLVFDETLLHGEDLLQS